VLVAQLDYIHFSFGLILFLLGAVCVSISRSGPLPTPWWMLGGFAFTLGVAEWLDVLAIGAGHPGGLRLLDDLLRAASFVFLLEFARRTTRFLTGDTPGVWIYGPALAVLAGVAVVVGPEGLEAAARLVLAGPASFWTAGLFFLAARRTRDLGGAAASRRARGFAAAFFALFGMASGLVLPPAPFLPEAWPGPAEFLAWTGVPVTLVRGLLVGGMSLSVWALAVSFDPRGRTLRKRRVLFWVMASAIVALLAGGWFFTERLGRLNESDTVAEAERSADAAHDHVVASFDAANRLARTLAALVDRYDGGRRPGEAGELDVLVDAVAAGQQDVIVYVLDAGGTTIASSNRASPSSLVGRNFRERPYFRTARGGEPGRFAGRGIVTGVPGYYASEPVRGAAGELTAVAVVKQDLIPVLVDPGGSGHVMIVSSRGDVVLSTRPGGAASRPSFPGAAAGTSWTTLDGRRHVAVVRDLPGTDWSLVLLQPEITRFTDRLLGIVITLLLCVVVLGAFVAMERQLGAEMRIATKRREAEGRARELARQVDTDALTGALNRQGFNEAMAREVSRSRRHGQPLAVVMVDIDHFKRVNDEFGHAAGDQVLVRTANLLRSCVRESDAVARWGGEEFVVIAPMTGEEGGVSLAEKLRAIMAATHLGPRDAVTASFGVAELEADDTIDTLLQRADGALYRAKESGRNRVCGATGGTVARPSHTPSEDPTKEDPLGLRDRMYTDTGFGPIDVDHATLSRALHALVHEVNSGKVEEVAASLDGVLRGVEAHFAHEGSLMARFDYPQRQRHAEAHAAFLADVRRSMQELREKGLSPGFRRWAVARLPDWFRFHILAHDMGLAKFLLKAGAEDGTAAPAAGREGPGPEPTRRP
jgi:two-component system, NtrC family, C4-dicarboxylate transport sensor histidine kinase DctB